MRTKLRSKVTLLFMTLGLLLALPAVALADQVANNADNTIDPDREIVNLESHGRSALVKIFINPTSGGSDVANCNFNDASDRLKLRVAASNTNATVEWDEADATQTNVAKDTIEFTGCDNPATTNTLENAKTLKVTSGAITQSTADSPIDFFIVSNNTGGTFETNTARITVRVAKDVTAPETTITQGPSGTVNSDSATFNFSSNEANSTFETRLDGGAWVSNDTATSKTYNSLADGPHTFDVRATDAAGNVDQSPASRSWTVQTVQATQISAVSGSGTYGGNATLTAKLTSGANNLSGKNVDFKVNGQNVGFDETDANGVAELSGVSLAGINAGTHTGAVSASFAGGGYSGSNATGNLIVDKAPTTTTVTCGAGPFVYNGSPHEPCSASVTGAGGLNENLAVSYENNVNAGTATASATYAESANHLRSSDSKNFTIDKAQAQVALSNLGPFVFDGAAKAAQVSTTPSGLNVTVTYNGLSTTPSAVGNYNVVATVNEQNYQGQATGTLVISPWTLKGFYQPIDMGIINNAKAGSTVPLKFEVFQGATELTSVSDIKQSFTQKINCASGTGDDIEQYSTGNTSLRYDSTAGQFVFNWQTPKAAGSCYRVTLTTLDGSTLVADFRLK